MTAEEAREMMAGLCAGFGPADFLARGATSEEIVEAARLASEEDADDDDAASVALLGLPRAPRARRSRKR
jgi:hypothetical protein